ncbi:MULTISPECIES: hypothetical protein [Neisseria]|uniref:hypothetical protein n=1 Tax=Neisseria TaxID=482 RepID=UPI0010718D3A|nr:MULTISPECIES: hypothetical protein [Neisseria]MBF0804684.1 hypothetical protein [Neisseria sp. 19428wB4_WF04]TFU40289.1 hypothetical protein E4T99_10080 [Neisseria sp. WF04]
MRDPFSWGVAVFFRRPVPVWAIRRCKGEQAAGGHTGYAFDSFGAAAGMRPHNHPSGRLKNQH